MLHLANCLKISALGFGLLFMATIDPTLAQDTQNESQSDNGEQATSSVQVAPSHVAAARKAMSATGATERLDRILPEVSAFTKTGLIANRPDIEGDIVTTVDEVAIELANRRAALENEVAQIYARLFTEEELNTISEFFSGETGNKFLRLTPAIFQQIDQVSRVWRAGIARDMSQEVSNRLREAGLQ